MNGSGHLLGLVSHTERRRSPDVQTEESRVTDEGDIFGWTMKKDSHLLGIFITARV